MNVLIDELAKSFLHKDSLEQCTVPELQQITAGYPFFAAAQLLLTKKLTEGNQILYKKELQKTSLFFQHPLWLQNLLEDNDISEIVIEKKSSEEFTVPEIKDDISSEAPELSNIQPAITDKSINDAALFSEIEESVIALKIPALKIEHPDSYRDDPAKAELTFEPYYTVDYFASQGIKIKEEEIPKDKFGLQLKSFTEWLKTMKRLPVEAIASMPESTANKKVEQLAEHSLENREVITEAMAEVWEKQGNTAKALEVYSKLSLFDPSKSSYFATKIEALMKIK